METEDTIKYYIYHVTVDNLIKQGMTMVEWYCMCKHSGDTVDHLLIHYSSAMDYWAFVFLLLGVKWVMSNSVQELLQCWRRRPKSFRFRGGRACQLRELS